MTECLYSLRKKFGNKDLGANSGRGHSYCSSYGIASSKYGISSLICLVYSKGVSLYPKFLKRVLLVHVY